MKKVVIGLAIVSVALVAVLYNGFGKDPHEVPFMLAGKPAPPFSLKRLDTGETVTLDQLKGRPLVLNFWATWCGPCQEEQPVINWAAENLKDQANFIGVVFDDTPEHARQYVRQMHDPMVQLVDPDGAMAVDYGASGVPETYFIDPNGIIRKKFVGPIDPEAMKKGVAALSKPTPEAKR
jgi:cytochrome c biogenesis protein CcmG/thiol:disulfide interchange protein DsbE